MQTSSSFNRDHVQIYPPPTPREATVKTLPSWSSVSTSSISDKPILRATPDQEESLLNRGRDTGKYGRPSNPPWINATISSRRELGLAGIQQERMDWS